MSVEKTFTKENLNEYLKEVAKEYRKQSGKGIPAEIILIGGASVLANYGFRDLTYDIDAIINASSAMKEAINNVGDRLGLPNGWLNMDFKKTKSYSVRLLKVSVYYKTFSNILTVRTVSAEYLIAMKLMSGRKYKNDLSDVLGILSEHQKIGKPITQQAVTQAVITLYDSWENIPPNSKKLIDEAFKKGDYEKMYKQNRESEIYSKKILKDFESSYPGELKTENIDEILERARKRQKRNNRDER